MSVERTFSSEPNLAHFLVCENEIGFRCNAAVYVRDLTPVEILKFAVSSCQQHDSLTNHIPPEVALYYVCFHGMCDKLLIILCTLGE